MTKDQYKTITVRVNEATMNQIDAMKTVRKNHYRKANDLVADAIAYYVDHELTDKEKALYEEMIDRMT